MQRVIPLTVEGVLVQIKVLHFRVGGDQSSVTGARPTTFSAGAGTSSADSESHNAPGVRQSVAR